MTCSVNTSSQKKPRPTRTNWICGRLRKTYDAVCHRRRYERRRLWKWSGRLLLGDYQPSSSRFLRCDTQTGGNVSFCSVSLLNWNSTFETRCVLSPVLVPSNLLLHSPSFQWYSLLPPWRCASALTPPSCFHAFTADPQARVHSSSRSVCLNTEAQTLTLALRWGSGQKSHSEVDGYIRKQGAGRCCRCERKLNSSVSGHFHILPSKPLFLISCISPWESFSGLSRKCAYSPASSRNKERECACGIKPTATTDRHRNTIWHTDKGNNQSLRPFWLAGLSCAVTEKERRGFYSDECNLCVFVHSWQSSWGIFSSSQIKRHNIYWHYQQFQSSDDVKPDGNMHLSLKVFLMDCSWLILLLWSSVY